jgi:glycosyltransferase involved in cell wall biosynthesis
MNWRDSKNPVAGGAELVTHEIAKRWVQWGNEVRLITSKYPSATSEELTNGVSVTRVGGKYTVYPASAYRFLKQYSHSYDVVIDQINSIPFMTPLYCRTSIVPLVFQLTRDIYYKQLPKLVSSFAVRLEPLMFKPYLSRLTLVLSKSTKDDLVSVGFRPDRIFVCPPGVDHESFTVGRKTPYPSILFLNRFAKYKNPDHLILAFKELLDTFPDCRLTLAGGRGGNDVLALSKLIHRLDIDRFVDILPFVGGTTKIKLLQESWVHVLPSLREGWGISILEAAACGTPTVGYDVPGVRDAVRHMQTGLLVPEVSAHSLGKAIINILQDEELKGSLSEGALKWASNFTWDSTAKAAMKVLITASGHSEYQNRDQGRPLSYEFASEVQGNS